MMVNYAIDGLGNIITPGSKVVLCGVPLNRKDKSIVVYTVSSIHINARIAMIDELIIDRNNKNFRLKLSKDKTQLIRRKVDPKLLINVTSTFEAYNGIV